MNIRVIIDKLGPIADSVVEFSPFVVYTGESGLGKSYTAMLWYNLVTAMTPPRLKDFVGKKMNGAGGDSLCVKFKDFRMWLNQGTSAYMGYLLGNDKFQCQVNYVFDHDDDELITIKRLDDDEPSNFTRFSVNGKLSMFPAGYDDCVFLMCYCLYEYLIDLCLGKSHMRPLILPPARASFMGANMTSSIGMYQEFLTQLEYLKAPSPIASPDNQFYSNYIAKLADGMIVIDSGNVSLRFASGETIPVSAAASSVKELMPFLLMLQNGRSRQFNSLLFEEPEAHVHPKKQFLVMDMLARCLNKDMFIQMTTHSDYLLGRMNQLLTLGKIRKASQQAFDAFCADHKWNKNLYLDADQVGAYYFKRDGGRVLIEKQDLSDGLPFSSFEESVRSQMELSAELTDMAERLGLDDNQ